MSSRTRVGAGTAVLLAVATLLSPAARAIPPSPAAPPTPPSTSGNAPVMVVLDASGSMTAADAPGPRINAAKKAVTRLVSTLPADAQLGLEVYGTGTGSGASEKTAGCRDIKILQPVGRVDRTAFVDRVNSIKASGYTPIGESLRRAAAALPEEGPRSIVLVSDGEDTCAPPAPCEVARELKASGVDLEVHAIGFKVAGKARSQLQCIAKTTGGRYTDATDGGSLGDVLSRQVGDAIRGYRSRGIPIAGGDASGAAPVIEPGQYLDTFARGAATFSDEGTAKFYRVDLAAGDTPYFSATVVPPALRTKNLSTLGIKIEARSLDGDGCGESDFDNQTAIDGKAPTATAVLRPGLTGSDDSCLEPGPVVVRVQRSGDAFATRPLDVELAYRVERPVDSSALPPAAQAGSAQRTAVSGTPVALEAGSSFNDAPALGTGVYRDTVTPGETRFVKVRLDWGQQLSYSFSAAKQDGYGFADGVVTRSTLVNPLREDTDPARQSATFTSFMGAVDVGLHGSTPVPARYRNRDSDDSNVKRFALSGDYYLVLSTGFADSGRSQRIPYTLRVEVTGSREPGPGEVTRPSRATDPSSTPSSTPSRPGTVSPSLAAGRDERDPGSSTPLLVAGITGGVLLLGGLAAGLVARRRRDEGDHTRAMSTGTPTGW